MSLERDKDKRIMKYIATFSVYNYHMTSEQLLSSDYNQEVILTLH